MSSSTRYTPLFETTTFPSPDGIDIILALWRDNYSSWEYIQCDICHKFFLVNEKRYPMTLGRHHNNATCWKAKEIHKRKQLAASTTAAANFVVETLFLSSKREWHAWNWNDRWCISNRLPTYLAPFNVCLFTDLSTGSSPSASPVPTTPTVDALESTTPKNLTPTSQVEHFLWTSDLVIKWLRVHLCRQSIILHY